MTSSLDPCVFETIEATVVVIIVVIVVRRSKPAGLIKTRNTAGLIGLRWNRCNQDAIVLTRVQDSNNHPNNWAIF